MDIIFSIIGLLLITVAVVNTIYSHFYKVVNMPSMPQTRRAIINDIRDQYGDCDGLKIIDLGSGWGGLCHKLSKSFPKAHIEGVEISPIPYGVSKIMAFINPFHHYAISRKNLFKMDLSDYDIIVCYLSHYHMDQFERQLVSQCKHGVILYSQGFPLPNKKAEEIIKISYSLEKNLYRYRF